ncbi:hypothetical protein Scep_007402 [Stephania cephalantha]|uniref:Uncharacterized protein n=1 Tax=Stephania cephalantha TaxID=152367 RepID=A0AAP0PNT2_9MAGN
MTADIAHVVGLAASRRATSAAATPTSSTAPNLPSFNNNLAHKVITHLRNSSIPVLLASLRLRPLAPRPSSASPSLPTSAPYSPPASPSPRLPRPARPPPPPASNSAPPRPPHRRRLPPNRPQLPLAQILGPKPSHPEKALRIARNALEGPLLIPLFNHRYIPSNPSSLGTPFSSSTRTGSFVCGSDLSDFFERESLFVRLDDNTKHRHFIGSTSNLHHRRSLDSSRTPRWVEFWSDAATDRRRRNSNSSSSSSLSVEYHLAICKQRDLWHCMDNMRHASITSSIATLKKPPTQTRSGHTLWPDLNRRKGEAGRKGGGGWPTMDDDAALSMVGAHCVISVDCGGGEWCRFD